MLFLSSSNHFESNRIDDDETLLELAIANILHNHLELIKRNCMQQKEEEEEWGIKIKLSEQVISEQARAIFNYEAAQSEIKRLSRKKTWALEQMGWRRKQHEKYKSRNLFQ